MIVSLTLLCRTSCLAEKVTVDPNAGPSTTSAEVGKTDPRLAQKVTYEAWHTPIKTILADLSAKTGVTFYAGYNLNDWRVRDRKMNVLVRDVSLAQLMNSIARVMKFKWSINDKKQPPTYRLLMDYRLLAKLQAEASKRENELKSEETRRRTELLDTLARVADASGSELAALKESNPYLYICAETGFAEFFTRILAETPGYREVFTGANKNLMPAMTRLAPDMPQLCASVIQKMWAFDHIWSDRQQVPNDLEQQVRTCAVHMDLLAPPFDYSLRQKLLNFGHLSTRISTGDYRIGWLKDPNSKSTQTWAKSLLNAQDQGLDANTYWNQHGESTQKAQQDDAKEIEYYFMFDPVAQHPDEPDLHKETLLKANDEINKYREEQLKACGDEAGRRIDFQTDLLLIADTTKLNVVSDSFATVVCEYTPGTRKCELQEVLDTFAEGYGCNWEKHGSILEIRRRDWFRKRSSQIPDEWMKPWREEMLSTGTVTPTTYFQMIVLDDDQIDENFVSDKLLRSAVGHWYFYWNNRGFARFYLRLTKEQHGLLLTEQGLNPQTLSADQWDYFTGMYDYGTRQPSHLHPYKDAYSITEERTVPQAVISVNCTFKVKFTTDDTDHWDIALPIIAQPKEKGSSGK